MKYLKGLIEKENPSTIISVGDIVSDQMIKAGISLNILIVDNKTMRKEIQPIEVEVARTFYAKNPAGTITSEAWNRIKQAIGQEGRVKVMIDGEEDLLTVAAVLSAPENALVVYGQPYAGIVVVKVTEEVRKNFRQIIESMVVSSKS